MKESRTEGRDSEKGHASTGTDGDSTGVVYVS